MNTRSKKNRAKKIIKKKEEKPIVNTIKKEHFPKPFTPYPWVNSDLFGLSSFVGQFTQVEHIARSRPNTQHQCNLRMQSLFRNRILYPTLYEWIQRARTHSLVITDVMLRETAQKIASKFNINDFQINFLYGFKKKYNLTQQDLISYENNDNKDDEDDDNTEKSEKKSLEISDLMSDMKTKLKPQIDLLVIVASSINNSSTTNEMITNSDIKSEETPIQNDIIEDIARNEQDDIEIVKDEDCDLNISEENFIEEQFVVNVVNENDENMKEENVEEEMEEIKDYEEALKYLEPLEKFAMAKENVRAIGLVNQLELFIKDEILKQKKKKK